MEYPLTIHSWEGDKAVLQDEEGNTVKWPQDKLPQSVQAGDKIYFNISLHQSRAAKDILNEVLNPEEEQ